jgi:hypothetical protein
VVSRIPEEWMKEFKTPLPLKRLGFSKVAQLLHSIPHVAKVVTQGSSCVVYLVEGAGAPPTNDTSGNAAPANQPADPGPTNWPADSAPQPSIELTQGETTKHVREWLHARVLKAGEQGLVASRIPNYWAEDYPNAGPLPLKQMGVNKLIKFLYACSDIVRTARPTLSDGSASVTEVLVFSVDTASAAAAAASIPPLPGVVGAPSAGASTIDPALVVRQGTQTWVKQAPAEQSEEQQQTEQGASDQLSAATDALAADVAARPRAPGTERPAMQLRAEEIEEKYGKGFAMLSKMGYKHDNSTLTSRTPIAVVPKTEKKGLYAAGEETGSRGANGKQQSETQGKDAVFVKEWLKNLLKSCLGEWGTMEPLAMSRIPDLWSQQFSGAVLAGLEFVSIAGASVVPCTPNTT